MTWLFAVLASVFFVETICRLPFFETLARFNGTIGRVSRVMRSGNISDHWKEKSLPRYAMRILLSSVVLFLIILTACVPVLVLSYIGQVLEINFLSFVATWRGMVFMTICSVGFAKLRGSYVKKKL
ncbi:MULTISPECIES: hypothetical protein [unclassified Ruegeria]|uniref:hypothetical protein n=1 Tax=unclassified Ruegeria TaxID=2625375 RepID=UPI0014876B04|nr:MULTISPECIES: hypothetical protein [unclassified Ruegeria]